MDEKLRSFAELLERQQAGYYHKHYPNSDPPKVRVIPGKKYIKVDVGTSGKYMVDEQGNIFGIKAYGVINKKKRFGTLDTTINFDWSGYEAVGPF